MTVGQRERLERMDDKTLVYNYKLSKKIIDNADDYHPITVEDHKESFDYIVYLLEQRGLK